MTSSRNIHEIIAKLRNATNEMCKKDEIQRKKNLEEEVRQKALAKHYKDLAEKKQQARIKEKIDEYNRSIKSGTLNRFLENMLSDKELQCDEEKRELTLTAINKHNNAMAAIYKHNNAPRTAKHTNLKSYAEVPTEYDLSNQLANHIEDEMKDYIEDALGPPMNANKLPKKSSFEMDCYNRLMNGEYLLWSSTIPVETEAQESIENLKARIEILEHDMKSGDYESLYAQTVHELQNARKTISELQTQLEIFKSPFALRAKSH